MFYNPNLTIAQKNAAAHPLLLTLAKKMYAENLTYYSEQTSPIRKQLEDEAVFLLVALKDESQSIFNGFAISDLTKEEQLMLVLFAAEIAKNGDLPYYEL